MGSLELDVLLGDVRSLKQKRSVVRPIVADLRRRFEVAVAEAGQRELQRRVTIGVAAVAADGAHVRDVRAACDRFVAERPEVELLSAARRLHGTDDE